MKNDSKFLWGLAPVVFVFMIAFLYLGHQNYAATIGITYAIVVIIILYGTPGNKWNLSERFLQNTVYVGYGGMVLGAIGAVAAMVCTMLDFGDYRYTVLLCGGVIMIAMGLYFGADQLKTERYPKITITEKPKTDVAIVSKVRLDNTDDDDDGA